LTHSHLLASKATYVRFNQIKEAEGKFVCNILPHKNLGRSQQHLSQQHLMEALASRQFEQLPHRRSRGLQYRSHPLVRAHLLANTEI
jgi:hypothetical protein